MNQRSPCRVRAQRRKPETSKGHVRESHNIWYDPARRIDGGQLAAHIDPRNLERCSLDLPLLPEAGWIGLVNAIWIAALPPKSRHAALSALPMESVGERPLPCLTQFWGQRCDPSSGHTP